MLDVEAPVDGKSGKPRAVIQQPAGPAKIARFCSNTGCSA